MAIEKQVLEACPECLKTKEELEDEGYLDTLYECDCGNTWARQETESHRCEECGHFAAKLTDQGCSECQVEVEEDVEVWVCTHCGEHHNTAESAYNCCGEALGEPVPPEAQAEIDQRAAQKAAKAKGNAERLEQLQKEYPPKYKVGDIITNIDLGSRGSYNLQAFVDAEVVALKPWGGTHLTPEFKWQYKLVEINYGMRVPHEATCDERDIEYRWCCPYNIVHKGEVCKRCGKPFDEISTERRR